MMTYEKTEATAIVKNLNFLYKVFLLRFDIVGSRATILVQVRCPCLAFSDADHRNHRRPTDVLKGVLSCSLHVILRQCKKRKYLIVLQVPDA